MNYTNIVSIFGALAIFIYGMILLSDSLEAAAGDKLKSILSSMTNNRFLALFTGFIVTAVVQSSSATTVMVIGFVNAGLLSLSQAIGVIMGANIGTTVTAWIINLTNVTSDMYLIALFAVIIGIFLLFMKKRKFKAWGNAFLGFGFIFIGLHLLKNSVPQPVGINEGNILYDFFRWIPDSKYPSLFLLILLGAIFTIVVQSSSVMMAFTITLASMGYIEFPQAAAIVLGENIGTTTTALLASIAGNRIAKKAAFAHTFFNIIGVCWMMVPFIFNFFIIICSKISNDNIGVSIALFHTFFNLTNTFILIWFIPYIEKLLMFSDKKETITYSLLALDRGFISTPDLALLEVNREINNKLFSISLKIFHHTEKITRFDEDTNKHYKTIKDKYSQLRESQQEVQKFLTHLMHNTSSADISAEINKFTLKIQIIESIAYSCDKIASVIRKTEIKDFSTFNKSKDSFSKMISKINELFKYVNNILEYKRPEQYVMGQLTEEEIDKLYYKIKKSAINTLKKKSSKGSIAEGLTYLEVIKEYEKIGDSLQQLLTLHYDDESI